MSWLRVGASGQRKAVYGKRNNSKIERAEEDDEQDKTCMLVERSLNENGAKKRSESVKRE